MDYIKYQNKYEEIYARYMYREKGRYRSSRIEISRDFKNETGLELTKNNHDMFVSYMDMDKVWNISRGKLPKVDTKDFDKNSKNDELYYSERYIELSTEKRMTPHEIILSHGLEPSMFVLVSVGSTKSKVGTKGNEEQYFINTYNKITVKPKQKEDLSVEDIQNLINNNVKPFKQLPFDQKESGVAYAINFFDVHVNSSGYSRQQMMNKVESARKYVINNNIEKVYIGFGGDFLHVNTTSKKTVAETQLTLVGDAYSMVDEAERLAKYIIERLSVVETEVYWVLGNHSDLPEYLLFNKVAQCYKDQKHIKFNVDKTVYKAYVYGSQFIMLSHGDININEIRNIPSQRFPKLWSKAKHWEVHLGHYHKESLKMFGSLVVRYQRTPKGTDDWEYSKGWWNSLRHIQAYTIDKNDGITGVHYL